MTTTFRADVRAALVTVLEAQQSATPSLLRKVTASRPGGFAELPCAYVSNMSEQITWDSGTRTRTMIGLEVQIVDTYREGANDTLDDLVDALVDRVNTAVQQIPNAILEFTGIRDQDEVAVINPTTNTTTYYRGVSLLFGRTSKWEGRS